MLALVKQFHKIAFRKFIKNAECNNALTKRRKCNTEDVLRNLKKTIINYIHISMLTYTLAGEAFLP